MNIFTFFGLSIYVVFVWTSFDLYSKSNACIRPHSIGDKIGSKMLGQEFWI
jgi:hypothetical protein